MKLKLLTGKPDQVMLKVIPWETFLIKKEPVSTIP